MVHEEWEVDTEKVMREASTPDLIVGCLIAWLFGLPMLLLPAPIKRRVRQRVMLWYKRRFPGFVRVKKK